MHVHSNAKLNSIVSDIPLARQFSRNTAIALVELFLRLQIKKRLQTNAASKEVTYKLKLTPGVDYLYFMF